MPPAGAIPIIGMAGAIGSGKSSLARAFARLGCLVIDSDAEAKAALDRPEVRDELVRWWGPGVIGADGRVDRRAVADRVFADAEQRTRLERLIHPLIRRTAEAARAEAAAMAGGPAVAVVYDAPLLFEAGIDAICDAVVFVDAPRSVRVERVRRTRGWDEPELDRREAMQWPVERKRSASRFVVDNTGPKSSLDSAAAEILSALGVATQ